jgi:hypothetical protein
MMKRKLAEVGERALTVYYLIDGLLAMMLGSTLTVIASLLPVSLNNSNPSRGHPLLFGCAHPKVIVVFVVEILKGAVTLLGYKQA